MSEKLLTQQAVGKQIEGTETARMFAPEVVLSRTLCGAATAASLVNYIRDDAIISTEGKGVNIRDLVHILREFDNTVIEDTSGRDYIWRGLAPNGASYFGALRTIFEGFDIPSTTRTHFSSITDFDNFLARDSDRPALLLSVSNKICSEVIHPLQEQSSTLSTRTERVERHAGHLVAILGKNQASGNYILFDPFGDGSTIEIDQATIDLYINLHPNGHKNVIAVARDASTFSELSDIREHYTPTHPRATQAIAHLKATYL